MKNRILIISSLGPKPYLGGIENVIDTIVSSEHLNDYEFSIFDTYRAPDPRRNLLQKLFFAITLPFRCLNALKNSRPQLIHIHFCSYTDFWKHSLCLIASKLYKGRTIFHLHGGSFDSAYAGYGCFRKKLVRYFLGKADHIIALSEYWFAFLSQYVNPQKIHIVPNPINCDVFEAHSVKKNKEIKKNILLIGSLGERKGHYDTLRALPGVLVKHPDAQVLFAGSDEDFGATEKLRKISSDLKIEKNVHFLGPVTGTAKLELIGNSSMVILPSYGENMPISLLEAMSASKPIISSKVGAIPEVIIHNKCGLLITPGDWQALEQNIIKLLSNPETAMQMGKDANYRVRQNWDVRKILPQYRKIYAKLINSA